MYHTAFELNLIPKFLICIVPILNQLYWLNLQWLSSETFAPNFPVWVDCLFTKAGWKIVLLGWECFVPFCMIMLSFCTTSLKNDSIACWGRVHGTLKNLQAGSYAQKQWFYNILGQKACITHRIRFEFGGHANLVGLTLLVIQASLNIASYFQGRFGGQILELKGQIWALSGHFLT